VAAELQRECGVQDLGDGCPLVAGKMGLQNRSDFAGRKNSRSRMRKRARPFQIAPGKPKEMHDIQTGDGETLMKVVREIVHVNQTPEDIAATDGEEPLLIEWNGVRSNNGGNGHEH